MPGLGTATRSINPGRRSDGKGGVGLDRQPDAFSTARRQVLAYTGSEVTYVDIGGLPQPV